MTCVSFQDECVAEANDNLNRSGTQLSRVFSSYPTIHSRASSRVFPAFERPFALGVARSLSSSDSKVWHERLPCCKSLKPDIKPIKCHFHGLRQTCTPTVAQFCQAGCNRCEICKQHPLFAMYQDIWREHGKRKIHPCSTQITPSRLDAYANASIGKNTTSTGASAGRDQANGAGTLSQTTGANVVSEKVLREELQELAQRLDLRFSWPSPPQRCESKTKGHLVPYAKLWLLCPPPGWKVVKLVDCRFTRRQMRISYAKDIALSDVLAGQLSANGYGVVGIGAAAVSLSFMHLKKASATWICALLCEATPGCVFAVSSRRLAFRSYDYHMAQLGDTKFQGAPESGEGTCALFSKYTVKQARQVNGSVTCQHSEYFNTLLPLRHYRQLKAALQIFAKSPPPPPPPSPPPSPPSPPPAPPVPCCREPNPEADRARKCHKRGKRGQCSAVHQKFCPVACGFCRICQDHPQFEQYSRIVKHSTELP